LGRGDRRGARRAWICAKDHAERRATSRCGAMKDLFPAPGPIGFSYREDFLSPDEEAALIPAIDAVGLSPFRFQGWLGKRLTASFGWHYDFDRSSFAPAEPSPDFLLPVRARAAAFAGLEADDFVQALLIRYDPGAGIGWH